MQFSKSAASAVLLLVTAALPAVHGAISIGLQVREGNTKYHVAWTDGLNACQVDVPIAPSKERLCNQNFVIDGITYYLVGCSNPNNLERQNPQGLRRYKDNSYYRACSEVPVKNIDCHGAVNDVYKYYVCG